MEKLFWNPEAVPAEVDVMLRALAAKGHPVVLGAGAPQLRYQKKEGAKIAVESDAAGYTITAGSLTGFARGTGAALAEITGEETNPFNLFGIMIDCSRNKVFTIEYLEDYLAKLALLGYNTAMLYTEDTYLLPEEPYFGYLRGAYSLEELQRLDNFAAMLGIELMPCIQTLGHLEQVLQWPDNNTVRDTRGVLMVDEPATYELIEKMIAFWCKALRSRRIHIGMDETHDLGRGRFLDHHGYERGFDLFNRHLAKVNEICVGTGYAKPTIWSDMYFRLANPEQDYYSDAPIPADVSAKIPKNIQLCYWDYYHADFDFYCKYIKRHQELCEQPIMGSGVWTWAKLWYDHGMTKRTVEPCVKACLETGLKELFFTMWGDDGGYCLYGTSLAGLAWAAGLAFQGDDTAQRFKAITGRDLHLYLDIAKAEYLEKGNLHIRPLTLVWDDPMLAVEMRGRGNEALADEKAVMLEVLQKIEDSGSVDSDLEMATMEAMLQVVVKKIELRSAVEAAYRAGDKAELKKLATADLPELLDDFDRFEELMREAWFSMAKPFGWEVSQVRNAGARARLVELGRRLEAFADGRAARIEELELGLGEAPTRYSRVFYSHFASSSVIK